MLMNEENAKSICQALAEKTSVGKSGLQFRLQRKADVLQTRVAQMELLSQFHSRRIKIRLISDLINKFARKANR
jgi:hypothetical protein